MRYNYPRPAHLVPSMFTERPALRTMTERESVLIQQFCDGIHWHNIVLIGPEQKAYYWEPTGKPLAGRSEIRKALGRHSMLLLPTDGRSRASRWSCRPTVTRAVTGRTTSAAACASEGA